MQDFGGRAFCQRRSNYGKVNSRPNRNNFYIRRIHAFWCHLHSAVKRSTVGSRAFPVAGPKTWNALPEDVTSSQSEDVTSSQSEYTSHRQLRTWLFKKSFPDIII